MRGSDTVREAAVTAPAVARRLARRLRETVADTYARGVLIVGLGVPGSILVVVWKIGLTASSPSLFLLANVLVSVAVAATRVLVFRAHHSRRGLAQRIDSRTAFPRQRRLYRLIGVLIAGTALAYVVACLLGLADDRPEVVVARPVAIALVVITLTELIFAIVGIITARRQRALLLEAARLCNLASTLVLLVLTQTALLSLASAGGHGRVDELSGVVLGSAAALIGLGMLVRSGIPRGRFSPDPLVRARLVREGDGS